ncbi:MULTISPECIES: PqqD family protein [unclassified Sphingomonas]|uniref:PqqD family protein n=1 Tax=unclassified Sphingomonas TaxID=196159 RepID=UPI000834A98D|nr:MULTISPECIES: PqqD family protein [unclassified Sphingomonas]
MSDPVYRASESVIFSEVEGETILLDTDSDKAFGLDPVAAYIWSLLQGAGKTRAQLIDAITQAYDVDAERAARDLDTLLDSLTGRKLVASIAG